MFIKVQRSSSFLALQRQVTWFTGKYPFLSFVQHIFYSFTVHIRYRSIYISNMLTSTFLTTILALSASALPTRSISRCEDTLVAGLVERDNWSVTRNDLVNGVCDPVTIIFARGTSELGNVGSLAGPPFFNALGDIIGDSNVAVQGVDYGATVAGYLEGGDPAGASTMASLINRAVSQCPSTQIVISGYRYDSCYSSKSLLMNIQPGSSSYSSSRQANHRSNSSTYLSSRLLW